MYQEFTSKNPSRSRSNGPGMRLRRFITSCGNETVAALCLVLALSSAYLMVNSTQSHRPLAVPYTAARSVSQISRANSFSSAPLDRVSFFSQESRKTSSSRICATMEPDSRGSFVTLDDLKAFGNTFDSYKVVVDNGCKPGDLSKQLKDGFKILDVRPKYEYDRIHPRGSIHVALIEEEVQDGGLKSLVSKWSHTLSGEDYTAFANAVGKKLWGNKKNAKLIVACGEGPRSLLATKALMDAGFGHVQWLTGGLVALPEGAITSEGNGGVGYSTAGLSGRKIAGEVAEGVKAIGLSAFSAIKGKYEEARSTNKAISEEELDSSDMENSMKEGPNN